MITSFPSLVRTHPRLPIELHLGPRSGEAYLISLAAQLNSRDLVDAGEWLVRLGRDDLERSER